MINLKSRIGKRIFYSLMLVSVIPLVVMFIYISSAYYGNLKAATIERELMVQKQSAENLSVFLQKAEFITNECYDPSIQDILDRPTITLIDQVNNQNQLMNFFNIKMDLFNIIDKMDSISILAKDDTLYYIKRGTGSILEDPTLFPNKETFKAISIDKLDKAYKHQILFSDNKGELYLARQIKNPDTNTYLGIILLQFSVNRLSELFPLHLVNEDNHMLITNNDGEILYSDLGLNASSLEEYKELEKTNKYLINNIDYNKQGFNISLLVNERDLLRAVDKLRAITILLIVLSYIAVIIIARKISQSLVRPIAKIRKGIDKISSGDYSYKLNIESTDELGDVAKAFENMSNKIDVLINEVYATELSEKEATIASLTSQINPHFLYNTLDMVKSMAEIEGNEDISDIVKALSVLFRYSTKTDRLIVTVAEEIANLENYIKIIDARFGSKIRFKIHCPDEVKNCNIIKLSLQPLVENSIQHGLLERNNSGTIIINITKEDNYLKIIEQDNGSGMKVEEFNKLQNDLKLGKTVKSNKYGGVGIRNINERIRLYYGEDYGINIFNYPENGLKVEMIIPLYQ
ncbi:MAG: sensor histidine kinase [Pleomorphochaeta sp.]